MITERTRLSPKRIQTEAAVETDQVVEAATATAPTNGQAVNSRATIQRRTDANAIERGARFERAMLAIDALEYSSSL